MKADRLATEKPDILTGLPLSYFRRYLQENSAMKQIPLTQGKFALVDDEDYEWLMTWKWCTANCRNLVYARAYDNYGMFSMHRLLMLYPPSPYHIDHINHNGLDNRRVNLRVVTSRQNQHNRQYQGSSKYPGVYWNKRDLAWYSHIRINGKLRHIGVFQSELNAGLAYQIAERWLT
jgi:hypothetical protein